LSNFNIRNATTNDIDFLVQTIVEAEKSGTEKLSYTTIFGLNEQQTYQCLRKIFEEDYDGCELSISSFLVVEKDSEVIAAVSAWIESKDGVNSNTIKGSLLAYILPIWAIEKAAKVSNLISQLYIDNEKGILQIGVAYVLPQHRGKKLVQLLINEHIEKSIRLDEDFKEVQVQVFANNISAIMAYEKFGFKIFKEVDCNLSEILNYLPDQKKVAMKYLIENKNINK
jgi:ribosomal protein S18 acetylase RimI-like enzyme